MGITEKSLASALNSMPSLTNLGLHACEIKHNNELTAALHRLCNSQLDHLTLPCHQLLRLTQQHPPSAMPRLRSLAVIDMALTPIAGNCVGSLELFPSLLHLRVSSRQLAMQLTAVRPPQSLSSFTVVHLNGGRFAHITARSFQLTWANQMAEEKGCDLFARAPSGMQQLTVSYLTATTWGKYRTARIFPKKLPATFSASAVALSNLVYIDLSDGLTLGDLAYLLTPASPPVFAAQLTHLAIRVHPKDRIAAAVLLPSLPAMYPKLSHVHFGLKVGHENQRVRACAQWDEAVQTARAALGTAWCDSAHEVVSGREDVAWRRSVGMPDQLSLPRYC